MYIYYIYGDMDIYIVCPYRVEVFARGEDVGQQKVEQRPELVQVVLHGRASDEQPRVARERAQHLRRYRKGVSKEDTEGGSS